MKITRKVCHNINGASKYFKFDTWSLQEQFTLDNKNYEVLRRRSQQPLETLTYLDLSGLGIGAIESLENCGNLQILDFSSNNIEEVEGIDCCQHLWNINFSRNQLSSLTQLSHFYAFGTVDLSHNNLSWKELIKIQDVIILDLHLYGNPLLEKDVYYRIHVIDCLPNIWMLDGRIITSAERQQVQHFFHDSALSSHPVRRKLSDRPLTSRQRMNVRCIHGTRTNCLLSKFPRNEIHSADTDLRRLEFLCENMQQDISMYQYSNTPPDLSGCCLKSIIQNRSEAFNMAHTWQTTPPIWSSSKKNDRERCNMLLLLLIASLEFKFPPELLSETLLIAKLDSYGEIVTGQLFTLNRQHRIQLACLLLSAGKLDRDMHVEGSGGLYDRLYLCLYYLVSDLVRSNKKNKSGRKSNLSGTTKVSNNMVSSYLRPRTAPLPDNKEVSYTKRLHQSKEEHLMLLASEIVLLLSVVPSFYKYLEIDSNLRILLQTATGDSELTNRIITITKETREQEGDMQQLYNEISGHIVHKIERASLSISDAALQHSFFTHQRSNFMPTNETKSEWKIILNTKNAYPRRPKSAVLTSGEHLTSGRRRTYADMQGGNYVIRGVQTSARSSASLNQKVSLGSNILLGPQNMARVIAMPEQNIALVQMNSIPAANGSVIVQSKNEEDHYCYVDIAKLELDSNLGCWKPHGTIGDKVTLQTTNRRKDSSLSKTPDALIFDKEHNRYSRRSSQMSEKLSMTQRNSPAKQDMTNTNTVNEDFKELENSLLSQNLPPRPLSALFKEKMNLRLPAQSSDVWTETDSQGVDERNLLLTSSPVLGENLTDEGNLNTTEQEQLFIANLLGESQPKETEVGTTEIHMLIQNEHIDAIDNELEKLLSDNDDDNLAEEKLEVPQTEIENPEESPNVEQEESNDGNIISVNFNEKGKEPESMQESIAKSPGEQRNRTSELRKRAISARQPKQAKVAESNVRPVSAVVRTKELRVRRSQLYRDDVGMDRPDSASSFQLERTEAWRSSASSSMNVMHELKSPRVQALGFMTGPENRPNKPSFQVIALRPTPPQRPPSPSQNTARKQTSEENIMPVIRSSSVISAPEKDKGIKLASDWLAHGRDLHEEYKKSRVYMTPHIPGYLEGIVNHPGQKKNVGASLPLTASLAIKLEKISSLQHSCKRSPSPATMSLREYLPPGIGIPPMSNKTKFSGLSDVKQLFGRYPAVSHMKPQKK